MVFHRNQYLFSGKASVKLLITTIETGSSEGLRTRGNYVNLSALCGNNLPFLYNYEPVTNKISSYI